MSKLISANRLNDGIVVYLGRKGPWVEAIEEAAVLTDEGEVETALHFAKADVDGNLVVDPFVVEIEETAEGRKARTLRDAIRAHGPTIDFLAKVSAEQQSVQG